MTYIGGFFLFVGAAFLFLAGFGIFRMPDILNQSQAGTKGSTLGIVSLLIGFSFLEQSWAPKLILIAIFFLFSSPIASHAICKAALIRGKEKFVLEHNEYENASEKDGE